MDIIDLNPLRQPLNAIIMSNDIINKMNDYINKYLNIIKLLYIKNNNESNYIDNFFVYPIDIIFFISIKLQICLFSFFFCNYVSI